MGGLAICVMSEGGWDKLDLLSHVHFVFSLVHMHHCVRVKSWFASFCPRANSGSLCSLVGHLVGSVECVWLGSGWQLDSNHDRQG